MKFTDSNTEQKRPGTKKYILCGYIYVILWNRRNESVVMEIRSLFVWGEVWVQALELIVDGPWELSGLIQMFYILIGIVVTWVFTFVKTH